MENYSNILKMLIRLPKDTVDGKNPAPVEVGSLSHYLQGFIHPRWLFGISSINSIPIRHVEIMKKNLSMCSSITLKVHFPTQLIEDGMRFQKKTYGNKSRVFLTNL